MANHILLDDKGVERCAKRAGDAGQGGGGAGLASTLDLGQIADRDPRACGELALRNAELLSEREDRALPAQNCHSHFVWNATSTFGIESGRLVFNHAAHSPGGTP